MFTPLAASTPAGRPAGRPPATPVQPVERRLMYEAQWSCRGHDDRDHDDAYDDRAGDDVDERGNNNSFHVNNMSIALMNQVAARSILEDIPRFDGNPRNLAIMGAAAGAAQTGLRPIAELMFMDFLGVCFDQIYNQAAKFRYMFGGKAQCPMVVRTMAGAGLRGGAQHSQNLTQMVTMVPGLKMVCPTNAYDAKGLLITAIRDNDCVIFVEDKFLYETSCEVPDEMYTIPFGEASFLREGTDVTIVGISNTVNKALAVADRLAAEGISCDVIDPRTTSPLDEESIIESVEVTGRLVIVDENW